MAPVLKTMRRADAEIKELSQWFSGVLEDQSHFMRYENIDYPELTYEEANAGWDDELIDDQYRITHQVWNYRRIMAMMNDEQPHNRPRLKTAADSDWGREGVASEPRWNEFRVTFPIFVLMTAGMMFIPMVIGIMTRILYGLTSWFGSAEERYINPHGDQKMDGVQSTQIQGDDRDGLINNSAKALQKTPVQLPLDPTLTRISMESNNASVAEPEGQEHQLEKQPQRTLTSSSSTSTTSTSPVEIDFTQAPEFPIHFAQPTPFIQQQEQRMKQQEQYITKASLNPQPTLVSTNQDLVHQISSHHFQQEGPLNMGQQQQDQPTRAQQG